MNTDNKIKMNQTLKTKANIIIKKKWNHKSFSPLISRDHLYSNQTKFWNTLLNTYLLVVLPVSSNLDLFVDVTDSVI